MRNLKLKEKRNPKLNKFLKTCKRTIYLWIFCTLLTIAAATILLSVKFTEGRFLGVNNDDGFHKFIIGLGVFVIASFFLSFICFYYYFKIWFCAIQNDELIKRQKRLLIFNALAELFLSGTIFIPLIAKWFFYLGYRDIKEAKPIYE